jgi:translation initiation factor IF-2
MGFGTPRPGGFPPRAGGAPGARPFGPRPAGAGFNRPAGAGRPAGAIKPTERFTPKANTFDNRKKTKSFEGEKSGIDRRSLLRRGIIEEQEIEERMLTRIFKTKKAKENSAKASGVVRAPSAIIINTNTLTVKTLSEKIGKTAAEIIKQLMVLGQMCTINSTIDFSMAELVAMEFGIKLELHADKTSEEKMRAIHKKGGADDAGMESRPAVVTVMGHVDHGKTSLLDAIRKTNVVSRESGGITQHIGAYQVTANNKKITFIDTPGHAAFDKMRARGAKITDIAILIVAADDGVMPQTIEAIKHIQNEGLPMIVAINKMDKKEANPDRIIQQLSEHNVIAEAWGGSAIVVPISATTGMGLDKLLEMILLVADMNAYKANPNKEAQGSIIDARLDKTRGPLVTVLVQSGTLRVGDTLLAGTTYGKVRGMTDENGKTVKTAGPSTPVMVLGFQEVPKAGDAVYVVDEKLTKQVVSERKNKEKVTRTETKTPAAGIDAFAKMQEADKKQLNVIIKGDVSGSVEAIIQSVNNITSDEVSVNVISSGVGAVNDNDVALAEMADAILIAFHTKVSPTAKTKAEKAKVKIHEYKVIYEIFDYITEQMVRLFSPKFVEKYLGKAEARAIFKSSAIGLIAGCMVLDGKVMRGGKVKLTRGGEVIGEYNIESLKIKTNDVKEVAGGFECGIKLENCQDVRVGDILECVGTEQLPIIFNGKKYEF